MARKANVPEKNADYEYEGEMGEYGAGLNRRTMDSANAILTSLKNGDMTLREAHVAIHYLYESVFPFMEHSARAALEEINQALKLEYDVEKAGSDRQTRIEREESEKNMNGKTGFGSW